MHELWDEHLLKLSTSHVLPTIGYQGSQRRGWVGRFHFLYCLVILAPRCRRTWVVRQCISHLVVTLLSFCEGVRFAVGLPLIYFHCCPDPCNQAIGYKYSGAACRGSHACSNNLKPFCIFLLSYSMGFFRDFFKILSFDGCPYRFNIHAINLP